MVGVRVVEVDVVVVEVVRGRGRYEWVTVAGGVRRNAVGI